VLFVPDFDTKSINIKPIARFYNCNTKYNYRTGLEITSVDLFNFFSILLSELKKKTIRNVMVLVVLKIADLVMQKNLAKQNLGTVVETT
jgi:hypothetical protein